MFLSYSTIENGLEKYADEIEHQYAGGTVLGGKTFGVPCVRLTVDCQIKRPHSLSILQYFILKAAVNNNQPTSVQQLALALELDKLFIETELQELLSEDLVLAVDKDHFTITEEGGQSYKSGNLIEQLVVKAYRIFIDLASGEIMTDDGKFLHDNPWDDFPLPPENYVDYSDSKISKLCDVAKLRHVLTSTGIYHPEEEGEIVRIANVTQGGRVYRKTGLFLVQNFKDSALSFRTIDLETGKPRSDLEKVINIKTEGLCQLIMDRMRVDALFEREGGVSKDFYPSPNSMLTMPQQLHERAGQDEIPHGNVDREVDSAEAKPRKPMETQQTEAAQVGKGRVEKSPGPEIRLLMDRKIRPEFLKALRSASQDVVIISPWINREATNYEVLEVLKELGRRRVLVIIGWGYWERQEKEKRLPDPSLLAELQSIKTLDNVQSVAVVWLGNEHSKVIGIDHKVTLSGSFNWLSYRGHRTNFIGQTVTITDSPQVAEKMMEKYKGRFLKALDKLWDKYVRDSSSVAERETCICAWSCLREPCEGLSAIQRLLRGGADRLKDAVVCLERLCLSQRGALKDGRAGAASEFLVELDKTIESFELRTADNFSKLKRAQRLLAEDVSYVRQ